jgi:hypothetical protein
MICLTRIGEYIPEAKGLIARPGHNRLPIWAHGQVQNPERMPGQSGHLGHGRVRPDDDLIQGIAMRGHHLQNRQKSLGLG